MTPVKSSFRAGENFRWLRMGAPNHSAFPLDTVQLFCREQAMEEPLPPPLPSASTTGGNRLKKIVVGSLIVLSCVVALGVVALVILRRTGLVEPFSIPTASMVPAVNPGDLLYMEALTYRFSNPKRGDVIVFKTEGIPSINQHGLYIKRVVGLPGDGLRLQDGTLYVNDKPVDLHNSSGEIRYLFPRYTHFLSDNRAALTVPGGHYFVLGDNPGQSVDSRYWGFLPAESVLGRAVFCYWPSNRVGWIQ